MGRVGDISGRATARRIREHATKKTTDERKIRARRAVHAAFMEAGHPWPGATPACLVYEGWRLDVTEFETHNPVCDALTDAMMAFERAPTTPGLPIDLAAMLRDTEDQYIDPALGKSSTKVEAAKLLGMERTTLVEKLRRRRRRGA